MAKKTNKARFGLLATLTIGVGVFYLYRLMRAEKRQKLAWLRSTSQVITTERGTIEYTVRGQGEPLLYIHGGMGGSEQGLALAKLLALDDFKVITVSRPGYRRTEVAVGGTLTEQAGAICKVLDHLGISTVSVIALSAGGMVALQLAQDYPERCNALILLSAQGPELLRTRPSKFWLVMLDLLLASDFFTWMLMHGGMPALARLMRVVNLHDSLMPMKAFFESVFPASDWRRGTRNDMKQLVGQQTIDLKRIHVPTLVLHGSLDVIVPLVVAEHTAANIPQAQLITIEDGSYMMLLTHAREVSNLIRFRALNI